MSVFMFSPFIPIYLIRCCCKAKKHEPLRNIDVQELKEEKPIKEPSHSIEIVEQELDRTLAV